jgi:hypothetical protein
MYDPRLMRFSARDPVFGDFQESLSLHEYLYCLNAPINWLDPRGEKALVVGASLSGNLALSDIGYGFLLKTFGSFMVGAAGLTGSQGIVDYVSYYIGVLPFLVEFCDYSGFGATGGMGVAFAHDDNEAWNKGWSIGGMTWLGGGPTLTSGKSLSGTIDIGWSPEAQDIDQLRGVFVEGGGSVTVPFRLPYLNTNTYGLTRSQGIDENGQWNGINLGTVSFGWTGSAWGAELHGYAGHTWVHEWYRN